MNRYIAVLCSGFLLFSISSFAQEPVKKGYYAIGNNASKLAQPTNITQVQPGQPAEVKKGYYSVGDNQNKLAPSSTVTKKSTRPVIQKGYYSIGNNADKLRQ